MTRRFRLLLVPLAVLALLAAGCGGGGKKSAATTSTGTGATSTTTPTSTVAATTLGSGDVATVGPERITKAQFDEVVAQAKKSYELQKRAFPAAGSPEYQTLVGQIMAFLVQKSEFAQRARELGVTVTDKQVSDRLAQIKKQYFANDEKRYQQQLKQQGLTEAQVEDDVRSQLISEGIYKKVTAKITVSDSEVAAYYKAHVTDQYTTAAHTDPASRKVRHILVKTQALADQLYQQLVKDHAKSFVQLVSKYTLDTSSKATGGELTAVRGQTVPPFDKAAFSLKTGELSKPVHSQYGWHIIQALSAITPAKKVPKKVTPLSEVRSAIRSQLLSTKQSDAMKAWVSQTQAEFAPTIHYAPGYKPASTTSTTPTTTTG